MQRGHKIHSSHVNCNYQWPLTPCVCEFDILVSVTKSNVRLKAIYPLIVILLVAQQKSVQDSMQDAISHSIHFGSVQPNTQNHHSLYGMSIIEMIQTRGNDQESQLHISVPETVAQEVKLTEEIGTPCSIGKGDISV